MDDGGCLHRELKTQQTRVRTPTEPIVSEEVEQRDVRFCFTIRAGSKYLRHPKLKLGT